MELLIVFLIGFFSYWFITDQNVLGKTITKCPKKEFVIRMAETSTSDKVNREIKEYSLLKIQEGHYEYEDVLNTLIRKNKNDKA